MVADDILLLRVNIKTIVVPGDRDDIFEFMDDYHEEMMAMTKVFSVSVATANVFHGKPLQVLKDDYGKDINAWIRLKDKDVYVCPTYYFNDIMVADEYVTCVQVGKLKDVIYNQDEKTLIFIIDNYKDTHTNVLGSADVIIPQETAECKTTLSNMNCSVGLYRLKRSELSYIICTKCLHSMIPYKSNFHVCKNCHFISREFVSHGRMWNSLLGRVTDITQDLMNHGFHLKVDEDFNKDDFNQLNSLLNEIGLYIETEQATFDTRIIIAIDHDPIQAKIFAERIRLLLDDGKDPYIEMKNKGINFDWKK